MASVPLPNQTDLPEKLDPDLWAIRQEFNAEMRRQHWYWYHLGNGTLKNQPQRKAYRLSREAEHLAASVIRKMGYQVNLTTNNAPFDLWVHHPDGRAARVEVKISTYHKAKKGGRYQADIRHHQADLLIFIARNGRDWHFVIPMADIAPRKNIAIWSYIPGDYAGQWAEYLDAWEHLERAIETAKPRPYQPQLLASAVTI